MEKKRRKNALNRVANATAKELEKYGFRIDCDARILYTPTGTVSFYEGMESAKIRTIINGQERLIDESKKITDEIVHEKIFNKLQSPLL